MAVAIVVATTEVINAWRILYRVTREEGESKFIELISWLRVLQFIIIPGRVQMRWGGQAGVSPNRGLLDLYTSK